MFWRARLVITAWFTGAFAVVLGVVAAASYFTLVNRLDAHVDDGIRSVAEQWAPVAAQIGQGPALPLGSANEGSPFGDVFVLVFRGDGMLVWNPGRVEAEELVEHGVLQRAFTGAAVWTTLAEHGERLRVLALPVLEGGRGGRACSSRRPPA